MKLKQSLIIILICLISFTSIAYADDSTTRSIVGDYFNKVFEIELSDGKGIFETSQNSNKRETINQEIYDGSISKNYSLYDRFGGNIKFIPYFGETKISTNLLDRFYTKFVYNDSEFELSASDILKFFESSAISNNVIYDGRANILSTDDIEAGNIDPRVYTYSGVSSIGGDAALGNLMLTISNYLTTLIGWLSGTGLYITINDIWNSICNSGLSSILESMVKFFLPLAISVFILNLVSKSMKFARGDIDGKRFFENIFGVLISLSIVFSLMANPIAFSNLFTKIVTIFDSTLDSAIQIEASDVVKSDNTDNVRVAALWEKTVFDQWCYGMFQDKYENLYTQYDENAHHTKMNQSHDDVKTEWNDGTVKYDSASITGDVKVQVGPSNYIRNWAALAWSTQSIYHIDAVEGKDKEETEIEQENKEDEIERNAWPRATTTPMNDQIFIDNFRWLDAKLNISPEYHGVDNVIMNYSNANLYKNNFVGSGLKSLYMTCLLIPIAILTVRKLINALKIVSSGFTLCYQSIANFIIPERYNVLTNIQNLIKPIYDFFWWSMIIFLAITTYSKIAGNNAIGDFVWILIGIYLCKFKPIRTPRQLRSFAYNKKKQIKDFSKNAISGLEKRINKK